MSNPTAVSDLERAEHDGDSQAKKITELNTALRTATDSGDSKVQYIGKSSIGSSTSSAVWQIRKVDETTGVVITWADGDDSFDNVWDDRETLNYS